MTKKTNPSGVFEIAETRTPETMPHVTSQASPSAPEHEARKTTPKEDSRAVSGPVKNVLSDVLAVPFPLLQDSTALEESCEQSQSNIQSYGQASSATKEHELPHDSTDDTLVDQSFTVESVQSSNNQNVRDTKDTSQDLKQGDHSVVRSRPLKKKRPGLGTKSDTQTSEWIRGEEDAIHLLMFHRHKLIEQHNSMLATQRVQQEQIVNFKAVEENLQAELRVLHQRLEEKEAEASEVQVLKPKLQARVRRFKDFLNGLHGSHTQLHEAGCQIIEDTQKARNEHQEIKADMQEARAASNETQDAIRREREKWTKELIEGDHRIKLLEQTIHNLQVQLDRAHSLSSEERTRYERLEQRMNEANFDHARLLSTLAGRHDEVSFICMMKSLLLTLC